MAACASGGGDDRILRLRRPLPVACRIRCATSTSRLSTTSASPRRGRWPTSRSDSPLPPRGGRAARPSPCAALPAASRLCACSRSRSSKHGRGRRLQEDGAPRELHRHILESAADRELAHEYERRETRRAQTQCSIHHRHHQPTFSTDLQDREKQKVISFAFIVTSAQWRNTVEIASAPAAPETVRTRTCVGSEEKNWRCNWQLPVRAADC